MTHTHISKDHEDCIIKKCKSNKERALDQLSCDYYATQSAHENCEGNARSEQTSCRNRCNNTKNERVRNCNRDYRADKKECREDKREDTKECRDAKKTEKATCKQNKIDEKVACKEMSGRAKRKCKKEARQNKKECKEQARRTKRVCKKDAQEDKSKCKNDAKKERDACIEEARDTARVCIDTCENAYASACIEERNAFNLCASEASPIFDEETECKRKCNKKKEEALAATEHNFNCASGHGGDKGATITFYNNANETRYYYRPEPYPETAPPPLTQVNTTMEHFIDLEPGDSYDQEVPCGVPLTFIFKDRETDGSDYIGRVIPLPAYPCCDEAFEGTYNIG